MKHNLPAKIKCPVCLGEFHATRDWCVHVLVYCMPLREQHRAQGDHYLDRACWCKKAFSYDMVRNRENAVADLKEHITGRRGCGVTTPNITAEEIANWTCLNDYLMNAHTGEGE